jgi:HTH-type transcriptional regulator/antitoxin MqsA
MVRETRDIPYEYEGQSTVIPDVTGDHCQACGEWLFSDKESDRIAAAMLAFNRSVAARG